MSIPIRLVVNGATGRMGRTLIELLVRDERFVLVGAVGASTAAGHSAGVIAPGRALRVASDWSTLDAVDAVIDFSTPAGLAQALEACQARSAALVSGTTGLDAGLLSRLQSAGENIAVLRAGNFSLGVALLNRLLAQAAAALPEWDLDILEAHHAGKQDAPSGTALQLAEVAARARGMALAEVATFSRHGPAAPRSPGSIGFAVVRGGDIVGEHTALLAGQGERLELTHRATDRAIFARGAIAAACWLAGKAAGLYALDQVLADRLALTHERGGV